MKNFRLSALLCCVSLCGFAACSDDKTDDQPEPQAYQVTQFESSTIPASIPGEGGGYKLTFVIRTETRSTGATFEPWGLSPDARRRGGRRGDGHQAHDRNRDYDSA